MGNEKCPGKEYQAGQAMSANAAREPFANIVRGQDDFYQVWANKIRLLPYFGLLYEAKALCRQINSAHEARVKEAVEEFRERAAKMFSKKLDPRSELAYAAGQTVFDYCAEAIRNLEVKP